MKKVLIVLGVLLLIAASIGIYMWNKPHRDISSEEAAYQLKSEALQEQYITSVKKANELYLDQTVAVKGTISSVEGKAVILDNAIYCTIKEGAFSESWQEGDALVLKGRVVGYDDLFEQVKLDFCTEVE